MLLELLTLFFISVVGTIFWLLNAELSAAIYVTQLGYSPIVVGAVCGLGQGTTYSLLYFFGEKLAEHWKGFRVQLQKTTKRFGNRLMRTFPVFGLVGGMIGLPPAMALAALASGLGVSYRASIPAIIAGRLVRFMCIGFGAETLLPYLQ